MEPMTGTAERFFQCIAICSIPGQVIRRKYGFAQRVTVVITQADLPGVRRRRAARLPGGMRNGNRRDEFCRKRLFHHVDREPSPSGFFRAGTVPMLRRPRLHRLVRCAVLFAPVLVTSTASAAPSPNVQGDWLTGKDGGVVRIARCGGGLCGRIVGIRRAPGEPMPTDLHGRSQCGLTIISATKTDAAGIWHGEITDPRDGHSYQMRMSVDQRGDLRLRVFVGIPVLGSTQVWQRFTGRIAAECRIT